MLADIFKDVKHVLLLFYNLFPTVHFVGQSSVNLYYVTLASRLWIGALNNENIASKCLCIANCTCLEKV